MKFWVQNELRVVDNIFTIWLSPSSVRQILEIALNALFFARFCSNFH